jgi:phosphatidylinositol phospholipase C epsilon
MNATKLSHIRLPPGCDLSDLESMLGFPEEIARCLTIVEMSIYRKVPAAFYLRHATSTGGRKVTSWKHPTVQDLIERYGEVINWVNRVATSATRADDRRVVISSLLRVALACKNMGNFMGVMEILSGLRSQNLESTWPLLRTKDREIFRTLSEMLVTQLNLNSLIKSLTKTNELSGHRLIFYFGWLLKRIKAVNAAALSVVLNEEDMGDESDSSHGVGLVAFERMVNLDKLNVLRGILDEIQAHVDSMPKTFLDVATSTLDNLPSLEFLATSVPEEETLFPEEELRADFPLFPLASTGLDLYILHQLHNGTTFIRYEDSSNPRTTVCVLKIMRCNSQLKWSKARWSSGKLERHESICNPTDAGAPCMVPDMSAGGFEAGYLYIWQVREIWKGNLPKDDKTIIRRHGVSWLEPDCCLSLSYGNNVADTRYIHLIAPVNMVRLWYNALTNLHQAVQHHVSQADQRPLWLRKVYHKLYKENGRRQYPSVAESCREFSSGKCTGMSFSGNSVSSFSEIKDPQDWIFPRPSRRQTPNPGRGPSLDGSAEKSLGQSARKLYRTKGDRESRRQPNFNPQEGVNVRELSRFEQTYPADNPVEFAVFSEMYDRFWSCYRSDLRLIFNSKATVKALAEEQDVEQPRDQSTDGEQGDGRKNSRRKTGTSLGPVVDALGKVAEAEEPCPDSSATEKKEGAPAIEKKEVTATPSLLSLGSVVSLALSQRKSNASEARSRWIAASQKKRVSKKPSSKLITSLTSNSLTSNEQPEPSEIERPVMLMNVTDLQQFMKTEQNEELSESACLEIIKKYEKNQGILAMNCLSLDGWIRFMTSKENYAFEVENLSIKQEEMTHPLSHYFIESSHNTYLTGHQLRGESTVEMYRQVLLTGCRCVELDCWDGEDGSPVIYHGHTLTTKIKFKDVVEAINEAAFITSPYPVILSFENHCSIPQQQEMARLCDETFKEKLVKTFLFEGDLQLDPKLPSPEQLKYRILIKNKKKPPELSQLAMTANCSFEGQTIVELGEADDVDEDYDEADGEDVAARGHQRSVQGQSEDFISTEERRRRESTSTEASEMTVFSSMMSREATYKRQKETNKIAEELSRLVIYTQAVKFDRLPSGKDWPSLYSMQPLPSMLEDHIFRREGSVHSFSDRSGTPFNSKHRSSSDLSLIGFSGRSFRKRGSAAGDILLSSRKRAPSMASSHSSDSVSVTNHLAQQAIQGIIGGATGSPSLIDIMRCAEPPSAFQTSSLAENTAKKLCKKQPSDVVLHTELQLMRVYPAAKRFDSSNYNPMMFWPCGFQLVALNYQTEDMAMQLNRAFFSQNGHCGYVLKPYVMWMPDDSTDLIKFNPWEIECANLPPLNLTITVISGQSLSTNHGSNVYVEVEVVGIPTDTVKGKTRQSQRNAFNPIWNEEFNYRVSFREIACVRFTVWDFSSQNLLAQRVVPLRYLRRGYRHLRLRSPQDNVLEVASLFICTQMNEETIGIDGWSLQKQCNEAWVADADTDQGQETPEVEIVEQQDEGKMSGDDVTLCTAADRRQPDGAPQRTSSSTSMKVVLYNL